MENRGFVMSSAQWLTAMVLFVCGLMGVEAADVCDGSSERFFLELYQLREKDPWLVSEEKYRNAALNYITDSEQCYEATRLVDGESGVIQRQASMPVDEGGIWLDLTSNHGYDAYSLLGTKWGADSPFVNILPRSSGGVVSYSYTPTGTQAAGLEIPAAGLPVDDITSIKNLPGYQPCFVAEITASFAAWSAIADIEFVEVADNGVAFNGAGANGDIRIGAHAMDGPYGVLEHAFYPPPNGGSGAGDIHFDRHETWSCDASTTGVGVDFGVVALHAIGHSIGLQHEFYDLAVMQPMYDILHDTLFMDDQIGAQALYGEPVAVTQAAHIDIDSSLVFGGGTKTFLGDSMQVGIRVSNLGEIALDNIELRFYLSVDNAISSADVQIEMVKLASLEAGNLSDTLTFTHTAALPGSYYLGVCVSHLHDTNPENDCSAGARFDVVDIASVQLPGSSLDVAQAGFLSGDQSVSANFGQSVSISGDFMLLGAPGEKAAYVYKWSAGEWSREAKLTVSMPNYDFGALVTLVGDDAFVANKSDSVGVGFSGAVYHFHRSIDGTWSLAQTIKSPVPATFEYFGSAIDTDGVTLMIGAPGVMVNGVPAGSVYAYTRLADGSWVYRSRIQAPDGYPGDSHGISVAYENGILAVGAMNTSAGVSGAGRVYLYTSSNSSWNWLKTLALPAPEMNDRFGQAVDLSGGVLVVGAPSRNALYNDSGAAYVYSAVDDWSTGVLLLPTTKTTPFAFGQSVKIQGGIIYVASAGRPGGVFPFVFRDQNWQPEPPLLGSDVSAFGGYSVDVSQNYLVMGVGTDSLTASMAGTAYIYETTTGTVADVLYNISVTPGMGGQVQVNGVDVCAGGATCQIPAHFGDRILFVAQPEAGKLFGGWFGECVKSGLECEKVVTGSESLSARFESPPADGSCPSRIDNIQLAGLTNERGCPLSRHYQSGHCLEYSGVKVTDGAILNVTAPEITFKSGVKLEAGTSIRASTVAENGDASYTLTLIEKCN